MKTIITVILIIVAVAAVLFILPFAIMFFSYVFGIDMDENGGLHECIGCPYRTCPDCEKDCKIYKRYQKKISKNGRGQRTGKILTGIRKEKTGEEKQKGG